MARVIFILNATWGIAVDCDNNTITWYCQGNVISQVQNTAIEDGVQYIPGIQMYANDTPLADAYFCLH